MSIIIFSRAIQTGKTTELLEWCSLQQKVQGILMPDVNGVRMMQNIASGERWIAECTDPAASNESLLQVGKFNFFATAFDKANFLLMNAQEQHPQWLVVDELGKLELEGKGLYKSIRFIIHSPINKRNQKHVVVVVRDNLLEAVRKYFDLADAIVITSTDQLNSFFK